MEIIIIGLLVVGLGAVVKLKIKPKQPIKEIKPPEFDLREYEIERSESERIEWDADFRRAGLEAWSNRYGVDYKTMSGYMEALEDYYSHLRSNGFNIPTDCLDEQEVYQVRTMASNISLTYKSPCQCVYCIYRVRRNIVKIHHEFIEAQNPKFVTPLEDRALMKELIESWKDLHTQKG